MTGWRRRRRVPVESPQRFLVEVQFSPGANYEPFTTAPLHPHVLPVVQRFPLHEGAPSQHPAGTGPHLLLCRFRSCS